MPYIHFRLSTGYTACGIRTTASNPSAPTGSQPVGGPLFTLDHFSVTCPNCISRME